MRHLFVVPRKVRALPSTRTLTLLLLSLPYNQFVADGVFFAELNEVLIRELAEDGYSAWRCA